ncbi:hypothetical protein E3U23_09680 [Erythrobacter litoralis]|uniref:hypothetical protein n=1 Tax=Erythrobacter litoralis TaxID=39960 RepID=UPI002435A162|nr:hypothetical protein [Erythrobacter litoralis]MDG6079462.1 hypothetical protein [Erythrobacter litoralis]
MITALVLAVVAQAAVPDLPVPQGPPTEEVAEQITVIGQRLKTFKGGVYKKDGKLTCQIAQSTGDKAVDMIRCGAMLRCYAPKADELDAIAASDASQADRNRRMQVIAEATLPCVENASDAGVRMLAEKRSPA